MRKIGLARLNEVLRVGVTSDMDAKRVNDMVLMNGISLIGFVTCIGVVAYISPFRIVDFKYLALTAGTGLVSVSVISFHRLKWYRLAWFNFLFAMPLLLLAFVFRYGDVSTEYYLVPGAIFASYLLSPGKWKSVLIFIFLMSLFILAKFIQYYKFGTPDLNEVEAIVYFPNIFLAFGMIYLATIIYRNFQEKQRQELDESNKVKEKLISIISHDLRSPIVSLKQLLEYSERNSIRPEDMSGYLDKLSKNMHYTADMIDNVLFWVNSQLKGIKANPDKLDLLEEMNHVVKVVSAQADQKGIQIEMPGRDAAIIWADRDMVRLVLSNLLNNAIKFSPANNGKVMVEFSKTDKDIVVSISDNGPGINSDRIDHIFSPEKTVTLGSEGEKGAGLGLLISKDLVELNKGKIWVDTTSENGTTMSVQLPV